MNEGSDELLRKKAMLLLRRERELFELRYERSRTEVWLGVFHRLSQDLNAAPPASLMDRWVSAMVDDLVFQVATVHACDREHGQLTLLSSLAPSAVAPEAKLEPGVYAELEREPNGFYAAESPGALRPLARALGLGMFYWMLVPTRGGVLLLTAGFVSGTERYRGVSKQDLPHFLQLARHLAALLENAWLIAELDREKSELSTSNQRLDLKLSELRETQEKLVQSSKLLADVSRRAGMAEVATGILHNVGNALNSVNVSIEVLADKLQTQKVTAVGRVAELLAKDELGAALGTDERWRKLPVYLEELATHLVELRDGMVAEVSALRKHVEHMKAIVGRQQRHATSFDVAQDCRVSELVDDAIALSQHALERVGVELVRDYVEVPSIVTDRHKVLQILLNLIGNARQALSLPGCTERKLWLSIGASPDGEGVSITVRDSGAGIPAENLEHLFRYGYTTKPEGHGFGLHTSANAARELGGRLSASSDGPGRGACFVLELPLASARVD